MRQVKVDVEEGRLTANEAKEMLADFMVEHDRLTRAHRHVIAREDALEALDAEPLDDFQARQLGRFTALRQPTLNDNARQVQGG